MLALPPSHLLGAFTEMSPSLSFSLLLAAPLLHVLFYSCREWGLPVVVHGLLIAMASPVVQQRL